MQKETKVYCPFYKDDDCRSIHCEGVIGEYSKNVFARISIKFEYFMEYCSNVNCENCKMYKAIMSNYNNWGQKQ